jgi:RluA family pseudouridine synthase
MPAITNIAAYQFAPLADLKPLRERLLSQCKAWRLRGTILLSTEGINLFVAGEQDSIDRLVQEICSIPGLEQLAPKYSTTDHQPFNRMLVRIKKEIIAFGVPGIEPAKQTSPKLPPHELKRWLDEGRPVTLLDTRNDYEVKLGTFENAITLDLQHFRNFPQAVEQLPAELKQQPIVMFCTGGIRCEKAGPFMQREGFEQIFQLEGGILKYFEDCGGAHYRGECFVFDQRVGVDPSLAETDNTQCFQCLTPLTPADQHDPRYVPNQSCPYCYKTAVERMADTIASRHAAIRKLTTPLPGSRPYENFRPVHISAKHDRWQLLEVLCDVFGHVPRSTWQQLCDEGRFVKGDKIASPSPPGRGQGEGNGQSASKLEQHPVPANQLVRAGECYLQRMPHTQEPDVNADITILHEDEAIVVVEKPAPLPVHPSGRYNRNTLQSILNEVYRPQNLRPAHRLDANTTGLLVLARTRQFASRLQPDFAAGKVEKVYVARVQGHPPTDTFVCEVPIGRQADQVGSRTPDETGLPARTNFKVLAKHADGTALIEARPLTGRTNQIRVHLWQLGWPICGDQLYLPNQQLGQTQTHAVDDPPLCLHAYQLTFNHPRTGELVSFGSALPTWFTAEPIEPAE